MWDINNYDPNEELPSPSTEAINQMLNSPSIFNFNKASTPPGLNPSNHNSLSSPPQSTLFDIFPFDEFDFDLYDNKFQPTPSFDNLGTTLPKNDYFATTVTNSDSESSLFDEDITFNTSLGLEDEKLSMITEPKAIYRERYPCETDRAKNRAQRYIRAEDDNGKHEYPTVKIPPKYCDLRRQLYIRVTPVTVKSKNVPHHCIHPYQIDAQENNVIRDVKNNSLYFPINENEILTGEKSFHISRRKMIQNDLKSYGPFRLFGSNQPDIQRVQDPQDAKQKISMYQLWKSQFVFTIAERQDNNSMIISILHTSVTSQVIVDEAVVMRNSAMNGIDITQIKCIPQKCDWQGGDEVLIIMPIPIKRKVYQIFFDFGEYGQKPAHEIAQIDTKTILFRTPSCPLLPGDENIKVSIIIKECKTIFPPIDFYYITPIKTIINICPRCQENVMNYQISNKRKCGYDGYFENDDGDILVSKMNQLSIEQKSIESHPRNSLDEKTSKFEKYLNLLKDSLEIFLRTNDPSRLFRRTRVLLSNFDKNSSPLNETIQHGHIQLALSVIEQIIDMPSPNRLLEKVNENDETPLLIAAKLNEWKLIEVILKNRSDLVSQKDKDENNLLHLLANLNEDKGAETIENVLKILPDQLKMSLLKEKNNQSQTPMEIAQSHSNTQCVNLLNFSIDVSK